MAHIVSFEIAGLAGRKETVKKDLNPGVNIFWGKNGCGKTSMLKILHSALLDEATLLARVPFTHATVVIKSHLGILERRIRNPETSEGAAGTDTLFADDEWHDLQERERLFHQATRLRWTTKPIKTHTRTPKAGRAIKHSYLSTLRLSDTPRMRAGVTSSEVLDEAAYDRIFARQIQAIWQDYYTRELMQIRHAQQRGLAAIATSVMVPSSSKRRKQSSVPEVDADTAYVAVKQFFEAQQFELGVNYEEFVDNYRSSDLMREVVEEVVDVQRGIESAQEPTGALQTLVSDLFSGDKKLVFEGRSIRVTKGGDEIPLQSLSSGEKQVVRLLIECLAAGANPVLIDEPELSMHVDWQHRLVSCMRTLNPRSQLILATHSPEIMADASDEEIVEL
ncbi:AAA family ATPase [Streptomyces albidoflavus]